MNDLKNELIDAVRNDRLQVATRLLDEGGDIHTSDEEGRPLTWQAIRHGASAEMLALLLDRGVDIAWTTEEGVGLLDEAVERNRLDLVTLLIERGLDPSETRRRSGMTALMLAASFEYMEMMALLVDKGADLFAEDSMGWTAVEYARRLGRTRAKAWLEEKMENPF